MRINHSNSDVRHLEPVRGVQTGATDPAAKQNAATPVSPAQRSDQVQISEAGRALAAQAAAGAQGAGTELSAQQVGEIRERVLRGAYNSLDAVQEVARRMLERGDI